MQPFSRSTQDLTKYDLFLFSSSSNSCRVYGLDVAIGFGGEDYKVVQLLACYEHRGVHAQLYSGKTNSWRELALDVYEDNKDIENNIKSQCKNGSFAHWEGSSQLVGGIKERFILSLDMENEVFRTITMPDLASVLDDGRRGQFETYEILAEDKDSFLLFLLLPPYNGKGVSGTKIYESRCEGSELRWIPMMNVEEPSRGSISLWMRSPNCVVLKTSTGFGFWNWNTPERKELIVYEYRARKFIGRFKIPAERSEVIEYKGSFVSIGSS